MTFGDNAFAPVMVAISTFFAGGAVVALGLSVLRSFLHFGAGDGEPVSDD